MRNFNELNIKMKNIDCIYHEKILLGECPVWDNELDCLYWIDIDGMKIYRYFPSTNTTSKKSLPCKVGSFALVQKDILLVALKNGLHYFNFKTEKLHFISHPAQNLPKSRYNDGRCDIKGRFWVGTMGDPQKEIFDNSFFCCLENGKYDEKISSIGISNGLAFSPEYRYMYFADTMQKIVWRYSFDKDSGIIENKQEWINLKYKAGKPDGACVDEDGCYWLAHVYGWKIVRYTPSGKEDIAIDLPVEKPSMCAFGGTKLDILFVTSIKSDIKENIEKQPYAGGVFAIHTGYKGLIEPKFAASEKEKLPV